MPRAVLTHRLRGAILGLAVTSLVAGAYLTGLIQRPELQSLDVLFRRFNRLSASPEIVHIDITDAALQQVHAWPWPRRLHAELIDLLNQLGARTIALDIVFAEPTPPRLELPQLSPDYDLEPEVAVRGQPSLDQAIYDDDELAEAIRRAGNVYLPVYFRLRRPPESRLQRDVAALLHQDFSLGVEAIAQRLGQRPALIDRILAGVKRRVADELVRSVLQEQPQATIQQVHRAILSSPFELPTADRQDIFRAYRRQRATAQILRRSQPLPQHAHAVLPAAYELTPPLPKLLSAARGVGFVVFEPDRDGVVRRLPLLVRYRGRLLKQLGLAVACDRLGIADRDIRVAGGKLLLRPPGRADLNVPLDATGRYLINWAGPPSHWSKVFTHIPVGRIMEIAANRRTIRQNNQQLRFDLAEMVRLFTPQAYADYASQVRRRNQILRQLDRTPRRTADPPDRPALQAELDALESRIARLEDNARYVLRQYYSAAQAHSPADQQEQRLFQAAQRLYPRIIQGQLRRQIARANGRLQLRIDQRMAELRPLIEGKICLVGYTASAVADFKSTPLFENTPGVLVHSSVINNLLQGRFIRPAGRLANLALILAAGLLASAVTVWFGPRLSLLFVLFLMVALAVIDAPGLFANWGIWTVLVSPMLAVFLSWSLITMYRQLTEERSKRQVATALAQYTAPAIAHQIVQDPARRDLSPVAREVTSFFSDLRGFTGISEQLGPARTRALLNPYLATMSQVLHRHHALINKFYGDGIFAFFNPPLLSCPDHARRACQAALDSLAVLEQLKRDRRDDPIGPHFQQLYMRIGIATGPVYVGDFGSPNKLDYTCLGDAVNLAARLESANKVFGTRVMVAQPTRLQADDDYSFRYLGDLQVKGKLQTVPVFELLGRKGQLDPAALDYAQRFAAGVELFKQRRWQECIDHFTQLLRQRPDDLAAHCYIQTCRQMQQSPPPPDWNAALELTEK